MENVFLEFFNMSITASWLVLAVVVFRFVFKKAPKSLRVIMWGLVALRLVCPLSLESVLSIIPSTEFVPPEIVHSNSSADLSGAEIFNAIGNNQVYYDLGIQDGSVIFTEYSAPDSNTINPLLIITYIASILWVVGMAVMLLYTLISYLRILKKVREATPLKENIWICDNISTPFILGLVKPRIFLPSSMNEQDTEFVIAHEKAHLKRRDHFWKPLGFALLTVYWFNPVLWVSYVLLCRDIELACDEKVIKEMGTEIKKSYSDALINCSVPRKMISACPLAFGETGVKGRIKSVLNYKKPAFWVIVVAVVAVLITTVCFMTNPDKDDKESTTTTTESTTLGEEDTTKGEEDTTESTTEESTTEESTTKENTTESTTKAYVPTPLKPLSTEKAIKIKQDYLEYRRKSVENTGNPNRYNNKTIEDVTINQYLGAYGNCIAITIKMNSDIPPAEDIEETVANYKFVYSSSKRGISVYRNGEFISLQKAYEKGWVSKENVRDIHYYYSTDKSIKNIYTPSPIVSLTATQELKIKEDYLKYKKEDVQKLRDSENQYYNSLSPEEQEKYRLEKGSPDNYIDELIENYLKIRVYFGTYNNCAVMILDSPFIVYFQAQTFNEIGGYIFAYPVMRSTAVYRNGEFVTLEQAYEKGWLSDEDMKDIYYYHCKLYCNYEYKDGDFIVDDYEAF